MVGRAKPLASCAGFLCLEMGATYFLPSLPENDLILDFSKRVRRSLIAENGLGQLLELLGGVLDIEDETVAVLNRGIRMEGIPTAFLEDVWFHLFCVYSKWGFFVQASYGLIPIQRYNLWITELGNVVAHCFVFFSDD